MERQKGIWQKVIDIEEWQRRFKIWITEVPKEENKSKGTEQMLKLHSRKPFWKKLFETTHW